ncbi:MAG TPA: hypothetical protein VMB25_20505 [Bryobacteraceae bacterium]|nr:hypothetical protein [Bryobacteraceae bacterium]
MRTAMLAIGLALAVGAWAQDSQNKPKQGPGKEIASGTGNIGKGAAKGAGSAAKGTAKGAGDLVTLHPVKAGESVGKGAVGAGKDVTVGTTKGTAKVVHGIGRAFKHLF